jgi:hypothetical protein
MTVDGNREEKCAPQDIVDTVENLAESDRHGEKARV